MAKMLSKLIKKIQKELINRGLINNRKFLVNNREICFTDLNKSSILRKIALEGFENYENEVVTLIKNYPWEVDIFIDGGANIGYYTVLASQYFPGTTEIIAVEPFPKNVDYIKKLQKTNNLKFRLIEKAIDTASEVQKTFYYPTAKTSSLLASSASLINSFQGTTGIFSHLPFSTIKVETITLPDIIQNTNSALIKLDCEGNELAILSTSSSILKKAKMDFIIELGINDKDKNDLFELMTSNGYSAFLITNSGFVQEERPLTFPYILYKNRTIWKNHFFTKRNKDEIKNFSLKHYGYWI